MKTPTKNEKLLKVIIKQNNIIIEMLEALNQKGFFSTNDKMQSLYNLNKKRMKLLDEEK